MKKDIFRKGNVLFRNQQIPEPTTSTYRSEIVSNATALYTKKLLRNSCNSTVKLAPNMIIYENVRRDLVDIFKGFGVGIQLIDSQYTPKEMRFFIKPLLGVRISQIRQRLQDVALQLSINAFKMEIRTNEGIIALTSDFSCDNSAIDLTDDLLVRAIDLFVNTPEKASISALQRHLGLGFAKAGRLMDELEIHGIVSPAIGSSPRKVFISKEQWDRIKSSAGV